MEEGFQVGGALAAQLDLASWADRRPPRRRLAGGRMGNAATGSKSRYDIETSVMFPQATHIDVGAIAAATQPWWNRTLTEVNDAVVRLGVLDGDSHWHKHDEGDEFFFVLEG